MLNKTLISAAVSLALIGGTLGGTEAFARGPGGHGGPGGPGAAGGPGGSAAPTQHLTLLDRLDTDGDGVLILEEFTVGTSDKAEREFQRKDTDADALLSLEEFSAPPPRGPHPGADDIDEDALERCMEAALGYELPERPDPADAFANADINLDDAVDLDEFLLDATLRAEERFGLIDTNADGALSGDELEAFGQERQEAREAHRTCVEEQLAAEDILD